MSHLDAFGDEPFDEELEPAAEAGGDGEGDDGRDRGGVPGEDADDDDEPVGYGRPPRQHRFKPGQSGNPKGRPKRALGLRTIVATELNRKVKATEGGKVVSLSKLQLIVKRLIEKAGMGEQRAIDRLIQLNIDLFGLGEQAVTERPMTAEEEAFLAAMLKPGTSSDAESGHAAAPGIADAGLNEDAEAPDEPVPDPQDEGGE